MLQRLILPPNNCKLTASWKTDSYKAQYGVTHYGVDLISATGAIDGKRFFYASGNGLVMGCGWDNVVGNVLAILYQKALHKPTNRFVDVIFRYFHLNQIFVKPGQTVNIDTLIATYGNTGQLKMDKHIHLEADSDIMFPMWSPTVLSSNLIRGRSLGANDKTMYNPVEFLHCKISEPECQVWTTAEDRFIRPEDKIVAKIK